MRSLLNVIREFTNRRLYLIKVWFGMVTVLVLVLMIYHQIFNSIDTGIDMYRSMPGNTNTRENVISTDSIVTGIERYRSMPENRNTRENVNRTDSIVTGIDMYRSMLENTNTRENVNRMERDSYLSHERMETPEKKGIKVLPLVLPEGSLRRPSTQLMIDILCNMYRREVIAGSMCDQLCDVNTIRADRTTDIGDWAPGKHVFMLNCISCLPDPGIKSVVMKLFWRPSWENNTNTKIEKHKTLESFEKYLKTKLYKNTKMHFNTTLTNAHNALSVIYGEPLNMNTSRNYRWKDLRSIAGLIDHDGNEEYISLRLFQKETFIPRVYGTCGPAYFVERAPALHVSGYYCSDSNLHLMSMKRRAEISIKLLQLTKDLDDFHEHGLIMCDMRPQNIGLTKHDQVVITDLDYFRYTNDFTVTLSYGPKTSCDSDLDCSFHICRAECNILTKRCGMAWTNNNLQVR